MSSGPRTRPRPSTGLTPSTPEIDAQPVVLRNDHGPPPKEDGPVVAVSLCLLVAAIGGAAAAIDRPRLIDNPELVKLDGNANEAGRQRGSQAEAGTPPCREGGREGGRQSRNKAG